MGSAASREASARNVARNRRRVDAGFSRARRWFWRAGSAGRSGSTPVLLNRLAGGEIARDRMALANHAAWVSHRGEPGWREASEITLSESLPPRAADDL